MTLPNAIIEPSEPARSAEIRARPSARIGGVAKIGVGWLACLVCTGGLTLYINPHSLVGYGYYLALWALFIVLFDRRETKDFVSAYLVNALLTALYVLAQVHFYPDSYGCTSPLGAQTDDSYFFSLVADNIPANLETRPGYSEYTESFSHLVRILTPFRVAHPLDVLYFLSGVAAMVCVYTRQLTVQVTASKAAGRTAYYLCQFCPILLMNGGAVFVRDTLVAGLFMLSLSCLNRRRFLTFLGTLALQYYLRPGTAFFILPLYCIAYSRDIFTAWRPGASRARLGFGLLVGFLIVAGILYWREDLMNLLNREGVDVIGFRRTTMTEVLEGGNGRGAFLWVQAQPLVPRLFLGAIYMLLVPFFSLRGVMTASGLDTRLLLSNVFYPLWVIPILACFFASWFVKTRERPALRPLALAFLFGCFLVGAFSLQSRHKVLIQPLFYLLAAAGWHLASPSARIQGFLLSIVWFLTQLGYYFLI